MKWLGAAAVLLQWLIAGMPGTGNFVGELLIFLFGRVGGLSGDYRYLYLGLVLHVLFAGDVAWRLLR